MPSKTLDPAALGPDAAKLASLAPLGTRALTALASGGLIQMLDPESQIFCYRLNRGPNGMTREGLSRRYTYMTLLGLHRMETRGRQPSPIAVNSTFQTLLGNGSTVDNLGDLGLILWVCALVAPEQLEQVYSAFGVKTALSRFQGADEGRTMELAWFLTGLAHSTLAGFELPGAAELAEKTYQLLKQNQGNHGVFGHLTKGGSVLGHFRSRIGSFADQVYPIYALTNFARAYQAPRALDMARSCADAICRRQGPLGQWWWHYDAITGKVFQRYPVYAVHQHGMAPMTLLALGEAMDLDFGPWIDKGLAWINGNNELAADLRETSSQIIWRCVQPRRSFEVYCREFSNFLKPAEPTKLVGDLGIKFECRPYELGWLLYAFAGRERD